MTKIHLKSKNNGLELDDFELSCIILVMQKINSEKWNKERNGLYLDYHDRRVLNKLVKIQDKRRFENFQKLFKVNK